MAQQVYHGQLEITSALDSLSVEVDGGGATAVSLDTGLYYVAGYTGEVQLCEHIQAKIRAVGTAFDASTVVYDFTTGTIEIELDGSVPGTSYDLTWTDTGLRDLLGFAADFSGIGAGAAQTAPNEARYTWRPDVDAAARPGSLKRWWKPRARTAATRARDGTVYTGRGPRLYDARIVYEMLAVARINIPDEGSDNIELEQFYEDVFEAGRPFRIYPDDSATTISDFVTAVLAGSDEDGIPGFADMAKPSEPPSHTHWDVQLQLWKHTP